MFLHHLPRWDDEHRKIFGLVDLEEMTSRNEQELCAIQGTQRQYARTCILQLVFLVMSLDTHPQGWVRGLEKPARKTLQCSKPN